MDTREPEGGHRSHDEHILKMLRITAHEIRGPLVSIMAGLQVVLHGSYGGMDEGVSRKLQDLHAHLNRLLGNADECLGRACCVDGAVPMHPEPLHLEEDILAVVAEELSREVQTHQVSVLPRLEGMPAGTVVAASRLGMKIVFRNLMRNAVKYGAAGCTIVCGYQDQRHHHRMNVFNSGTPIPPECQGRLFTKFGTLANPAEPWKTGVGLGLHLTREIVHAHGGAIWYEAHPGGSNFVFTLPKVPAGDRRGEDGFRG